MAKVTITLEDQDGMVAAAMTFDGYDQESPSCQLAYRIQAAMDAMADRFEQAEIFDGIKLVKTAGEINAKRRMTGVPSESVIIHAH